MVEQTGSIFVECEHGFFHSPSFSDLIIRNHKTHSPEKNGSGRSYSAISLLFQKAILDILFSQRTLGQYMVRMIVNVEEWGSTLKFMEELRVLKLGVVVIHIPHNIKKKITFLIGESDRVVNIPVVVYEKSRITFLSDFSKALLKDQSIRQYPEVATFAFWCRSSNLNKIIKNH